MYVLLNFCSLGEGYIAALSNHDSASIPLLFGLQIHAKLLSVSMLSATD